MRRPLGEFIIANEQTVFTCSCCLHLHPDQTDVSMPTADYIAAAM